MCMCRHPPCPRTAGGDVCRSFGGGRPFEELRHLNIDAITYWFLRGLTVDGLPRSLWYTPQHAAACALSLIALAIPAYAPPRRPGVGLVAGIPLGLALIVSPAIGGAFSVIYGLTAVCCAVRARSEWFGALLTTASAAVRPAGMARCWRRKKNSVNSKAKAA